MSSAPAEFRKRISDHNRHAVLLGVASFVGAFVLWEVAYFFFVLILLGLTAAARGDWGPAMPVWIPGSAAVLVVILLVWGTVDQACNPDRRATDRAIIGWHLIPDFLLLPVRLTFAVWGNLSAVQRLDDRRLDRAWELLLEIQSQGKARARSLSLVEPDAGELRRLVGALQYVGFIDLLRGEDEWFYLVRSDQAPVIEGMVAGPRS